MSYLRTVGELAACEAWTSPAASIGMQRLVVPRPLHTRLTDGLLHGRETAKMVERGEDKYLPLAVTT
jgi:hypothetical protein